MCCFFETAVCPSIDQNNPEDLSNHHHSKKEKKHSTKPEREEVIRRYRKNRRLNNSPVGYYIGYPSRRIPA